MVDSSFAGGLKVFGCYGLLRFQIRGLVAVWSQRRKVLVLAVSVVGGESGFIDLLWILLSGLFCRFG